MESGIGVKHTDAAFLIKILTNRIACITSRFSFVD